jgi:hypothetical protein
MCSLGPWLYTIINLICTMTLANKWADQTKTLLGIIFPLFMEIGIISASQIFVVYPVKDREDKLRYLLNFVGIRPSAYYIGQLIGDWLIYCISSILLVLTTYALKLDVISYNGPLVLLILLVFGFPFISTIYFFSNIFDKSETAFKWIVLFLLLLYALPKIIMIWGNETL